MGLMIWMSIIKGIFSLTAALILWCFPDYWDKYAIFERIPRGNGEASIVLSSSQHTKYAIGFAAMSSFFLIVAWSKMYVKRAVFLNREKQVAAWSSDFIDEP